MYRYSTIIILLVFGTTTFAQNVKVSEGHSVRNDDSYSIIGKINKNILLFANRADSYEVIAYDDNMAEQWRKIVEFDSKRAKILHIADGPDDFTIVYRYNKRGKIYTQAVKMSGDTEILQTDTMDVQANRSFFSPSETILSKNKRYLLVYETELNNRIHARIFDMQSMETVWTKVFALNDIELDRDLADVVISDTGQAYFIFSKNNRRAKKEENHFIVMHYDDDNGTADYYIYSMKGRVWLDVKFAYDNMNNRLVGAGLYSEKRYNEAKGYFYLNIEPLNTDDYTLNFQPFDSKFIVKVVGKAADKVSGINEVNVQELVLRQDGGLLMIVERNRRHNRRASTYMPTTYATRQLNELHVDYHYEDILLFSVHPDGELHWKDNLQKRQFSQDDDGRFSSYFLMHTRSNLRFLYNDEIRTDTNINEYIVNGKGRQERNSIYNSKKENLMLLLKEAVQVASNELIVPSERRSTFKLVKITY